jgi:hypothetical protein
MIAALYALGGAIFFGLGSLHAVYTLADLRRPRRLVPADAALIAAMRDTGVRLAGGGTTMWRAWPPAWLPALAAIPALIAALYGAIGLRCWFSIPNTGIAIALSCFGAAALGVWLG